MEYTSVPIIVIICYVIGEIYKKMVKKRKKFNKYIPIILTIVGGILGLAIYKTSSEMIMAHNEWEAILIGILSGVGATGTNQIIKQIYKKGE